MNSIDYPDEAEALSFDSLMDSMWKCKRGVSWKASVAYFVHHSIEECLKLEDELANGRYRPRKPKTFWVTHPKPREIKSTTFRDRVYQRCLNDLILYPAMTCTFIHSNCACQTGKGTDYARTLYKGMLHRSWIHHGTDFWVLQIDVKGYYEHMRHDITEALFRPQIPDWAYRRTCDVLDGQYAGETGYNPGSQMVQIAGISYLSPLDHFIKERLRIREYIRYMDDLYLFSPSFEELEHALMAITEHLAGVGLHPHPVKTKITRIIKGITFLGFRYTLKPDGKIYMKPVKENIKHERRRLKRMAGLVERGQMPTHKLRQCYQSWEAHADHGDSHQIKQTMRTYLKGEIDKHGIGNCT